MSSIERLPRGAREREREGRRGEKDENGARQKRRGSKKRGARSEKSGGWEAKRVREARAKGKNVESRETERSRIEAAGFLSRHRRRHPTKIDPVRVSPRPPRTGRVCVCTGYPACHRSVLLARDMLGLQWRQRVFRPRSLSPPLFFFHFFLSFVRSFSLPRVHRVTLLLVHGPNTERETQNGERRRTSWEREKDRSLGC